MIETSTLTEQHLLSESSIPAQELQRWHQAPEIEPGVRFVKFQFCNTLEVTYDFPNFLADVSDRVGRWKQGRYTVKEAAQVLSEAHPGQIDANSFRRQTEKAIQRGKLIMRKNGVPLDLDDLPTGPLATQIVEERDVNEWLSNEGSPYRLAYPYQDNKANETPHKQEKFVPKLTLQRDSILQWLRSNGYNPNALPARMRGKSGPKAEVKAAMLKNASMFTEKSFEKAWESLRSDGSVLGAD